MTQRTVVLPPGPTCAKCGHEPCPFCLHWCDVLLLVDVDGEEDTESCCDGECELDTHAVELWRATFPDGWNDFGVSLQVAESSG